MSREKLRDIHVRLATVDEELSDRCKKDEISEVQLMRIEKELFEALDLIEMLLSLRGYLSKSEIL